MVKHRFERMQQGEVVLDLCFPCQGIWFDDFESVQITPGGVIQLFKLIHQHRDGDRQPLADLLRCPRCDEKLLHGMDVSKHGGKFNYHRCLQKHGRFTTFSQFMIEKGFVRHLQKTEIDTLSAKVAIVRCNSCGAPVDIRKDYACGHCRSPIAILDPAAVEKALARYQQAEVQRTTMDVEALGDAIIMKERQRSQMERDRRTNRLDAVDDVIDVGDLLIGAAAFIWKALHD